MNNIHQAPITAPAVEQRQGKGLVFYLITLYLFFDLIRPDFVWHFPKLISAALFIAWLLKTEKISSPQIWGFVAFVGILGIDIVIAENTYDAVWTTQGMVALLFGICVPMILFTDTLAKFRHLVNALLVIFLYIAVYAILNAGNGPAGARGAQDENYVAAAMNLAIPLAGFSFFAEKILWKKIWFAGLVCLYISAIVVGFSRGGFVGLVCVLGYSVMKAPRMGLAISALIILGCFLALVAGPTYWNEMATITDPTEGTADLRLEFWKIAIREFMAYPLTGVGGDNFRWRIADFQSPDQFAKFDRVLHVHVHSTYFQLLAEMGLAGCITFGFIIFRTYKDYRHLDRLAEQSQSRAIRQEDNALQEEAKWLRNYGRGLMGGLIGYLTSIAFLSALYFSHLWIAVSLIVALHSIATRRLSEDEPSLNRKKIIPQAQSGIESPV